MYEVRHPAHRYDHPGISCGLSSSLMEIESSSFISVDSPSLSLAAMHGAWGSWPQFSHGSKGLESMLVQNVSLHVVHLQGNRFLMRHIT